MKIYITGTSSGIGKALAELLLENNFEVVGLSRRQTLNHPNYIHITIDLSDLKQLKAFNFPANYKDDVVLVNNAGKVGPIKPVGQQITKEIVSLNCLNVIAPQVLMNKFICQYKGNSTPNYQIINISSGAGKRPIDAWAAYCASKAAIDLFSETVAEELAARNHTNWKIYSIAPGVVDTEMQKEIRASSPKNFLSHQKFIDLKINNELNSVSVVAEKLKCIIEADNADLPVKFSLHDVS
ncbi:MAG: SDR family NAD(P)-dependent oxidoreductase [Crocinitomicaceae bacterium]